MSLWQAPSAFALGAFHNWPLLLAADGRWHGVCRFLEVASALKNPVVQQDTEGGFVTRKHPGFVVAMLLAAGLIPVVSQRVQAQRIQFTPSFGMYLPHGAPLLDQPSSSDGPALRKAPVGAALFGSKLAVWLSRRVGVEGNLGYSPGLIAVKSGNGTVSDVSARLVLASVTAQYRISPTQHNALGFQFGSGVGVVNRSGRAWADTPAKASPAFVLTTGMHTRLDPRRRLTIRAELEDYVSWPKYQTTRSFTTGVYNDLLFSIGLGIPITGSGQKR
jgi:hypothetical protein